MKKIIISPYSSKHPEGKKFRNSKDYPWWNELILEIKKLDNYHVIQIGVLGEKELSNIDDFLINKTISELKDVLYMSCWWISVDNFFHHFAHYYGRKGFVLFGPSDPNIFGYSKNINILKNRRYVREDTWGYWKDCIYNEEAFCSPYQVISVLNQYRHKLEVYSDE